MLGDFADDFFDGENDEKARKNDNKNECPSEYRPKIESPAWFCEESASGRFKGDFDRLRLCGVYHYHGKQWTEALECFSRALELSRKSSSTQLEVVESLARTWLKLGNQSKALELAREMELISTNGDQQGSAWLLYQTIFRETLLLEKNPRTAESAFKYTILLLIKSELTNPVLWEDLLYFASLSSHRASIEKTRQLCLLKAQSLLAATVQNATGFSRETFQAKLDKINASLAELHLDPANVTEKEVVVEESEFTYRSDEVEQRSEKDTNKKYSAAEEEELITLFVNQHLPWISDVQIV